MSVTLDPRKPPRAYSVEIGDFPGGTVVAFECIYPDAPDGGLDLVLPIQCPAHNRSWYLCLNAGVLWCDSGPPDWMVHSFPS